jgi:hypothetical protein
MPNDTTLKSVFDYAKGPPIIDGEFPTWPVVYATFVEHFSNSHPRLDVLPGGADLVTYANGPLTLSANEKVLSGECKLWRNKDYQGDDGGLGQPPTPPDVFRDAPWTVTITVMDSGQATWQRKTSKGHFEPLFPMNAVYDHGLFVERETGTVRSLSFTLA